MLKKYCAKCGQATEYKLEAPSFCSKCGVSLSGKKTAVVASAKATRTKALSPSSQAQDEDDYEHIEDFNTNLTSLAFNVERFEPPTPTIGQIASLGPHSNESPTQQGKKDIPPVNEKQFLKDFQQEAGSIKKRNDG